MKTLKFNIINILLILSLISCDDDATKVSESDPINVDLKMEVQILDSNIQLYPVPHTKVYFTTYKLNADNEKIGFEQSDTTSCPNGWGVKLLSFKLANEKEKIVLGAACEDYDGPNYREVTIDYNEVKNRAESSNNVSMTKTFAIYY